MPKISGATFDVNLRYTNGPFGDVDHVMSFEDGRFVDERFGVSEQAEVTVEISFLNFARLRAGEYTILEALEGGNIKGEIGPLAALAGILESPEYEAAKLASGTHAYPLAVLGLLDADEGYAAAIDALSGPAGA
jgi:hypothetical protein